MILSGIEIEMPMVGKAPLGWLLSREFKTKAGINGAAQYSKLSQAVKQFEATNPNLKIYAMSMLTTACVGGKGCDNGTCVPIIVDDKNVSECGYNVNRRKAFLPSITGKGIFFVAANKKMGSKAKYVQPVMFIYGAQTVNKYGERVRAGNVNDIWLVLGPGRFNLEQYLISFRRAIYKKFASKKRPGQAKADIPADKERQMAQAATDDAPGRVSMGDVFTV
jgi:hypothetical protein